MAGLDLKVENTGLFCAVPVMLQMPGQLPVPILMSDIQAASSFFTVIAESLSLYFYHACPTEACF